MDLTEWELPEGNWDEGMRANTENNNETQSQEETNDMIPGGEEEAEENTKDELTLDSKGHCLICLAKVSWPVPGTSCYSHELEDKECLPVASLGSLFRYLRLRIGDASTGDYEPKGLLCEECTSINISFTEAFRKWEEIKVKMADCLKLVRWKLMDADPAGQQQFNSMKEELNGEGEEIKLVEEIRSLAIKKCSLKLATLRPLPPVKKAKKAGAVVESSEAVEENETEITEENGTEAVEGNETEAMDGQPESPTPSTSRHHRRFTGGGIEHRCRDCGTIFPTKNRLKKHRKLMHAQLQCPECGEEFTSARDQNIHRQSVHHGIRDRTRRCDRCHRLFQNNGYLVQHQAVCWATEYILSCRYCRQSFQLHFKFKRHFKEFHLAIHAKKKAAVEERCPNPSPSSAPPPETMDMDYSETLQPATEEPETITSSVETGPHNEIQVKVEEAPQNGIHQVKVEVDEEALEDQGPSGSSGGVFASVPGPNTTPPLPPYHNCPACSKVFKSKHDLAEHYHRVHLREINFHCKYKRCKKAFWSRKSHVSHYRKVHLMGLEECGRCEEVFQTRILLDKHLEGCDGGAGGRSSRQ